MISTGLSLYAQAKSSGNLNVSIPVISNVNPSVSDVAYPLGKRWINSASNTVFYLSNLLVASNGTVTPTWTEYALTDPNITEFVPNSGTSPVLPLSGAVGINSINANIGVTGTTSNEITVSLADPLTVHSVTLAHPGDKLNYTDRSSSTASFGTAPITVGGVISVPTSVIQEDSIIIVSPRGYPVNNFPGSFQIFCGTGGPYPPTEVVFNYIIIN